MIDLKNYMINEGRMSTFELKNYAKSAITNSSQYKEYFQYLTAALEGIQEGIVENERYYKKNKEVEDLQKFGMIIDDFMELLKKSK